MRPIREDRLTLIHLGLYLRIISPSQLPRVEESCQQPRGPYEPKITQPVDQALLGILRFKVMMIL